MQQIERSERARMARALIEDLDETCREAVSAFYLEEMSYKDMSERFGIAVNTVGSRLAKCLEETAD